jgi:hypothetical protein
MEPNLLAIFYIKWSKDEKSSFIAIRSTKKCELPGFQW